MYAQLEQPRFARGLYLATMAIDNKPGTHYAILDVGNLLNRFGVRVPSPFGTGLREP